MSQTNTTSAIRGVFILKRGATLFVISAIIVFLIKSIYQDFHIKNRLTDLKELSNKGISAPARIALEYSRTYNSNTNETVLTFNYHFIQNEKKYENTYIYHDSYPSDEETLRKLFTVHYLADNPEINCLNIDYEIEYIKKEIEESSLIWTIGKSVILLFLSLVFLVMLLGMIEQMKNINKPIEIPDYLKKQQ